MVMLVLPKPKATFDKAVVAVRAEANGSTPPRCQSGNQGSPKPCSHVSYINPNSDAVRFARTLHRSRRTRGDDGGRNAQLWS
jgi:hypothetical protein